MAALERAAVRVAGKAVMWASAVVVEAIQIIMNVSWKVWWKRKS
jgi:hypothetical protein